MYVSALFGVKVILVDAELFPCVAVCPTNSLVCPFPDKTTFHAPAFTDAFIVTLSPTVTVLLPVMLELAAFTIVTFNIQMTIAIIIVIKVIFKDFL